MDEVSLMTDTDWWENTDDNVKMMTIHTSKWLEFPYVFIVWLEDWIFPLARTKMVLEELEEERRLMYVWVTRAKAHLFLSHANMRRQRWQTKYNSPSQFIEEIPENYKKHYDFTNSKNTTITTSSFEVWDNVIHKLFWEWVIHEIRDDIAFVDFGKYKFRKVELRFLQKK
jgi:ATP-dependent exoDNAse (exonuclease V) beta subunit